MDEYGTAGRPNQSEVSLDHRDFVLQERGRGVVAAEYRIGAQPCETVLDDVAAAHVLEQHHDRERGVIDLIFQLGFALGHVYATRLELIDDPIAAPQPDEMQDEALVGGIVYDLELRALLDQIG